MSHRLIACRSPPPSDLEKRLVCAPPLLDAPLLLLLLATPPLSLSLSRPSLRALGAVVCTEISQDLVSLSRLRPCGASRPVERRERARGPTACHSELRGVAGDALAGTTICVIKWRYLPPGSGPRPRSSGPKRARREVSRLRRSSSRPRDRWPFEVLCGLLD
ncbi:hypothetical protein DMC30DRAFT_147184 [Rhodotorula diobovata]|uniref:Uncharacterized protein n=1 Tax=Rhodotorula diobovata TaxID=5288 RepID=A0A5C5FL66_9BASI|nr:hypothetical protein DMC30DRAFT_147184 [Rhodotorula diobovata]